jgi:hypothetical protein
MVIQQHLGEREGELEQRIISLKTYEYRENFGIAAQSGQSF